ncbi:MAG: hypothetical protein H7Y38_18900 [Armatimonadetes bacterium]|nr:hypothetical protein [Armatimonadota bacterium]
MDVLYPQAYRFCPMARKPLTNPARLGYNQRIMLSHTIPVTRRVAPGSLCTA